MTNKEKDLLKKEELIFLTLILALIFPHARMIISAVIFALVGALSGGWLTALIAGIVGIVLSINDLFLGIASAIIMLIMFYQSKINGKNAKVISWILIILSLFCGSAGNQIMINQKHDAEVAEYHKTHPTKITRNNVKQRVETQFNDDNVNAKVSVTGYDYSTGGSIIIKLNESALSVDKFDINQAIVSACKALSKMNYKDYDGVNIKIQADDDDNYTTVGYAHVDKNNIPKINKNNIQSNVSDYQNKGD